jgi:hypothetical protein
MRMVLKKMKVIKLKVHFIVGNGIERSEYIANNLKITTMYYTAGSQNGTYKDST